jgi:hypothetical protein
MKLFYILGILLSLSVISSASQAMALDSSFSGHYGMDVAPENSANCSNFASGFDLVVPSDLVAIVLTDSSGGQDANTTFDHINAGKQDVEDGSWTEITLNGYVLRQLTHACFNDPNSCLEVATELDFAQAGAGRSFTYKLSGTGKDSVCYFTKK